MAATGCVSGQAPEACGAGLWEHEREEHGEPERLGGLAVTDDHSEQRPETRGGDRPQDERELPLLSRWLQEGRPMGPPPAGCFDDGLEWLLDGMAAALKR